MKHTPGTWRQGRTLMTEQTRRWSKEQWDDNEIHEKLRIFANFSAADEGRSRLCIAEVRPDIALSFEEAVANARLIAAAPVLLAAVQAVLRHLKAGEFSLPIPLIEQLRVAENHAEEAATA